MAKNIVKKTPIIGLCMILLILTIPIASAQQLNIVRVSGKDSPSGYSKTNDDLEIEVKAQIPYDQNIGKEQVRLFVQDAFAFFDSCQRDGNTQVHTCKFSQPGFSSYTPIDFTIKLFDDDSKIVAEKAQTLQVDAIAPQFKTLEIGPDKTNGKVTIDYKIEDYGIRFGQATNCSGIKEMSITGQALNVTEPGALGRCVQENKLEINLQETTSLCVSASDWTGHSTIPKCKKIFVDSEPPKIYDVKIETNKGLALTHVKQETNAIITAKITDDVELEKDSVTANFAKISKIKTDRKPNIIDGDIYLWSGMPVVASTDCSIKITAKDVLQNEREEQVPCDIRTDNTGPNVLGLRPERFRDNKPLYGKGTNLMIAFEDKDDTGAQGIGFGLRRAYLDLSALGLGSLERAQYCAQRAGEWLCIWSINPPDNIAEGEYQITLKKATADDLENTISAEETFTILYDNTGPEKPEITSTSVLSQDKIRQAIKGSSLRFTVKSSNFETAIANFSDIGGDERAQPSVCADLENGEKECEWTQRIELSGPFLANIEFIFEDDAGNRASTSAQINVYGLEGEERASLWKTETECSPKAIDRGYASVIPQYISCRVNLKPVRQGISTLSITGPESPQECTGDIDLTLNDVYLTNAYEDSLSPTLILKLEPRDYYDKYLNITCPISITSKREGEAGGYISPLPQIVNVNVTSGFHSLPQRDMYSEVERQIEKAMDDSFANQEWLGQLRKFIHYGERICQIKTVLTSVVGTLYTVASALGLVGDSLQEGGITSPAGTAVKSGAFRVACGSEEVLSEGYAKTILNVLDEICSLLNCAPATGGKQSLGVLGVAGGNVEWCQDVQKLLSLPSISPTARKSASEVSGIRPLNIKDSLVWSSICFCVPGIVYNLEKLRQINCYKAVCLHDEVKEQGYPVSYCNEMHGYLLCQYVIGQIFAAIPFSQLFEQVTDLVVNIISNPATLFTVAIGAVCLVACEASEVPGSGAVYIGCAIAKVASVIGEAVASVQQITKTKGYFSTPPDSQYCKRLEKIKKEYKEKEEQ